jgi:hypothetical protein
MLIICPAAAAADACRDPQWYEEHRYWVQRIRIETPLQFLGPVERAVGNLKSTLPLRERTRGPDGRLLEEGAFTVAALNAGIPALRDHFNPLRVSPTARVAARLIAPPQIENCDDARQSVDAVYRVYTFQLGGIGVPFFQEKEDRIARSVPDTRMTRVLDRFLPAPLTGYDRSKSLYGGTQLSLRHLSGPIHTATFSIVGSANCLLAGADLAGSYESFTGGLRELEWNLHYFHSDLPAGPASLRDGLFSAHLSAETQSYGDAEFFVRFGAALEGGARQSDADPRLVNPVDVASAGVGSLKLYGGVSLAPGVHSLKASYGLQLGKTGSGIQLDYLKQIFDAAYATRLLPWDHRPVTLDSRLTMGSIHRMGPLPLGEQFFGGNVDQDFIHGDSWRIRSAPYLRSIPSNRFSQVRADSYLGADRFVALNVTAGITVWGHSLASAAILQNPQFDRALRTAMQVPELSLYDEYLAESSEYRSIAALAWSVRQRLEELVVSLEKVADTTGLDENTTDLAVACLSRARSALEPIRNKNAESLEPSDIRGLFIDFIPDDPGEAPIPSKLAALSRSLKSLTSALPGPDLAPNRALIDRIRGEFERITAEVNRRFPALESSAAGGSARAQAARDMKYPRRILRQLLYEVNLIGISPIAMLDVGRVWQQGPGAGDIHYGIGGGIRISLIMIDLSIGYAWNLRPKPWEGRGALTFGFEISDLFR